MKSLISVLKYLLMLGIGAFLLWLVLKGVKWDELKDEIAHIHLGFITLAFLIAVFSHWLRGARWVLLIQPLGYKVSRLNGFLAVMIGYLANLALPRMGEVSRCLVLNRTNKVPIDKLIGTVVVERIVDVISLLLILLLNLTLEFAHIKGFFSDAFARMSGPSGSSLFTTGNLVLGLVILALLGAGLIFLLYRLRERPFMQKIIKLLSGFAEGIQSIRQMEQGWLFVLYSVGMWLMYYLQVYICFKAMPGTMHLDTVAALSVLTMGSFGFVAPVQGGVGAYHGIVALTLEEMYGVVHKTAAAFALVAHTFQTIVVIVLGALSYLYITLNFKKIKADESVEADPAEVLS